MLSKFSLAAIAMLLAIATHSQQLLKTANSRPHAVKSTGQSASHVSKISEPSTIPDKCGFALMMQHAVNRGFDNDAFEREINRLVQYKISHGRVGLNGTVTVPIVFHVIYRTADTLGTNTANLAAGKFQAQVSQLNIDYANTAGSGWGAAANVPIRFCMALVDTAGRVMAEPGIDRINGQLKGWSNTNNQSETNLINNFDNTIKPGSIWDPYSYVNVWTASMNSSGLLGYATFPAFSTLEGLENSESNTDAGVVIAWQTVGSVLSPGVSAPYGYGRTLTHELGHFFGLRHIWGDASCGNDYCEDTPPQSTNTTGCPATDTMNSCVPLTRKMYENYMDYSYDACLNTFTNNQSLRSEVVMDNSPRRISLITSKACTARPGNSVSFVTAARQSFIETGTSGGCPNTRSYAFRIYASQAATAAATLTFATTGSATIGKDFTISPASVVFAAGDTVKTVTIIVIDDQVAEPDETISLSYNISGSGVIAGLDKQSVEITISDDDISGNIGVNNTLPLKSILTQNFDTSTGVIPVGWVTENYAGATLLANQWTVSANGGNGTTGRAAHITNDTILKPNIYTNTNPADAYLFTPLLDASDLRDLNIVFKWRCRGESGYDAGYIGYVPEGMTPTANNVTFFTNTFNGQNATAAAATANLNLPAVLSGKKFYFVFNWYNDETVGNSPAFTVDSIIMTGKAYTVASTIDADTSFSHFMGQTVNYFSRSGAPQVNRIIAKIAGMSTDAGCITASIPSAGAGHTIVNTSTGQLYHTDKVIKLTPAAVVQGASYQVTLYYSVAELAVWGSQIPVMKMLKLTDGVSLAGPWQAADMQIATPTFTDNAATGGYYSYTATFSGGFSQFMMVSPDIILPVSLLDFSAKPHGKTILLQWSTSQEINNRGFVLERSIDGVNFTQIAWVDGKGTSNVKSDYSYSDLNVQYNKLYYYRLRQTDLDNREKVSETREARIKDGAVIIAISPVPARDYLQVSVSGANQPAVISLLNAQGQLVKYWPNKNLFSATYRLEVKGLPAGAYVVKIDIGTAQVTRKITIER